MNGAKVYISRSNVNHTVGPNHNKYSDAKKISTKKSKYTLKVGKKAYLNAKATTYNGKKQVSHSATMKYVSSDTSVATVTKKGKIKAVGKGSCKLYIVSACGLTKTVTVTVK